MGHEKSWWYTMERSPKFLTCTLNLLSWSRGSEVSWSFGDLRPSCRDSLLVTVTSMNNNMEQFSQSHSVIACLYGERKSRCQKNIFHSSAFIPKSRKRPFSRGDAQKQLSKVEATTVITAHTQTEGTFHCTNPTNPPRNKQVINRPCSKLAGDEARARGGYFHFFQSDMQKNMECNLFFRNYNSFQYR